MTHSAISPCLPLFWALNTFCRRIYIYIFFKNSHRGRVSFGELLLRLLRPWWNRQTTRRFLRQWGLQSLRVKIWLRSSTEGNTSSSVRHIFLNLYSSYIFQDLYLPINFFYNCVYTKQNKKTSYKNIDFTASMEIFKLFVTDYFIV